MIRAVLPTIGDAVAILGWLAMAGMYTAVRRRQVLDHLESHDIHLVTPRRRR